MVIAPAEGVNLHPGRHHEHALSPTQLDALLGCEERWRLSIVERLRPTVRSIPLEMGAAFAEATEHADPQRGSAAYMASWEDVNAKYANDPWAVVPSRERAEINATIVAAAARAYLARYGRRELREQTFRVPIRGGGHDLLCRIDGRSADGSLLIEDKLVGRIDRANMERWLKLDRQVSIEFYASWRATGVLAERMSYRMTLKCGLRRGRRESHDEFLARVAADYVERPDFYLAEFEATRTLDDFVRLERDLANWSMRLVYLRATGAYTRNTARCRDFNGCDFLPLCSGEPGAARQFVERERRAPIQQEAA